MPWKADNEIRRLLLRPLAAWDFAPVSMIGSGWRCYGRPIIQRHTGRAEADPDRQANEPAFHRAQQSARAEPPRDDQYAPPGRAG